MSLQSWDVQRTSRDSRESVGETYPTIAVFISVLSYVQTSESRQ
jgi:hypothetical protein